MPLLDVSPPVLTEPEWTAREAAHQRRIDAWVLPHQQRRRAGETHPVWDFLFTYYSETPGRLRRWHPGPGTVLTGGFAVKEVITGSGGGVGGAMTFTVTVAVTEPKLLVAVRV